MRLRGTGHSVSRNEIQHMFEISKTDFAAQKFVWNAASEANLTGADVALARPEEGLESRQQPAGTFWRA
jgi:hypothetical protein